jgi:ElaA protein
MEIIMLTWQWRSFSELKNNELYDLLSLRQTIFIIEQQCIYNDLDYLDQKALHLLGYKENQLVAYLRLFPKDIPYANSLSFGRVLTAKSARGQSIGKEMIIETLRYLKQQNNITPITISAQLYLKKFYESFGFKTISEPYDEDGIPHIKMIRQCEPE